MQLHGNIQGLGPSEGLDFWKSPLQKLSRTFTMQELGGIQKVVERSRETTKA